MPDSRDGRSGDGRSQTSHLRYIDLPDPAGERYDDGSYDTIIAAGWPALYPTRADHVELHVNGFDIDLSEQQLRWLADNAPVLLGWLKDRPKAGAVTDADVARATELAKEIPRDR